LLNHPRPVFLSHFTVVLLLPLLVSLFSGLLSQQGAHLPAAVVGAPEEEVKRPSVHRLRVHPDTPGDDDEM
jgi:hypothetical protein